MIKRTLKQIENMIQIENDLSAFKEVSIKGISIDSRKIEQGQLFVPFKGENIDGHKFVEDAIQKGAAAAFWQKDVPNPPLHLPILMVEDSLVALQELSRSYRKQLEVRTVGITGSNGKTTTKDMITNLLSLQFKVQKTEGNYNNHIGLPLTILSLEEDTEIAVLEMGMSGRGEIEFLTKLAEPEAVIITNIGEAHLQDLGSREAIAEAKLEIIEGLKENGLIVYHGDEPLLKEPLKNLTRKATTQTFGQGEENDLYPVQVKQTDIGSTFTTNRMSTEFHLPVLGIHNVLNALGSMLIARYFGVAFEMVNEGFSTLKLTNMRMELLEGAAGERIINDAYNASPTSMRAAINLVTELAGFEKKILVLADMLELGPEENKFHLEVGENLDSSKIDYVFTYGKLGQFIAEGAQKVFPENRVFSFSNKEELSESLKPHITQSTLILVKGSRGMKLEDVVHALQQSR